MHLGEATGITVTITVAASATPVIPTPTIPASEPAPTFAGATVAASATPAIPTPAIPASEPAPAFAGATAAFDPATVDLTSSKPATSIPKLTTSLPIYPITASESATPIFTAARCILADATDTLATSIGSVTTKSAIARRRCPSHCPSRLWPCHRSRSSGI